MNDRIEYGGICFSVVGNYYHPGKVIVLRESKDKVWAELYDKDKAEELIISICEKKRIVELEYIVKWIADQNPIVNYTCKFCGLKQGSVFSAHAEDCIWSMAQKSTR